MPARTGRPCGAFPAPDPPPPPLQHTHALAHSEYFTFVGVLTRSVDGTELLNRAHVFNLFYFLTELKSRDDIVRAIVTRYAGARAPAGPYGRRVVTLPRAVRGAERAAPRPA